MTKQAMHNLFVVANDAERIPLIAENPDWENIITPALIEMGTLIESGALDLNTVQGANVLRVIVEMVYVMGHREGARGER
jgi:hypothetical protein